MRSLENFIGNTLKYTDLCVDVRHTIFVGYIKYAMFEVVVFAQSAHYRSKLRAVLLYYYYANILKYKHS